MIQLAEPCNGGSASNLHAVAKDANMSKTKPKPKAKPKAKAGPKPSKKPAKKADTKPVKVNWASPEALAAYDRETSKIASERVKSIELLKRDLDLKKKANAAAREAYEEARLELQEFNRQREESRGKPPVTTGSLFDGVDAAEREAEFKKKIGDLKRENEALQKQVEDDEARAAEYEANRKKAAAIVASVAGATAMPSATSSPAAASASESGWYPDDLWKRFPLRKWLDLGFGLTENDVKIFEAGDMKEGRSAFPMRTIGDVSKYTEPMEGSGFQRRLTDLKGLGKSSLERYETAQEKFWSWWAIAANLEAFAKEQGYSPDKVLGAPAAPEVVPAASAKSELRGGGAKPARQKKSKKGAEANASANGAGGDHRTTGDGATNQPGSVDEFGFPTSYSDPPQPGADAEGAAE